MSLEIAMTSTTTMPNTSTKPPSIKFDNRKIRLQKEQDPGEKKK